MRPFKMFFFLTIGVMLLMSVAKIVFFAFIVASIMSIFYAIYRRIKDFITYDSYGEYYIKNHAYSDRKSRWTNKAEPLFYENFARHRTVNNIRFSQTI